MIPTSALISVPFHGDVRSAATPSAAGLGRLIGQGHALAAADLFDPAGEFAEVAGAGGADGPTFNFCHILRQLNQHRQKLTEHGLYGILSSLQNCDIRLDPCQPFVAHHRPLTVLTSISLLTPRVTIRLRVETVAENHLVRFLAQADAAPKVHAAISMPGICFPEHRPMAGVRLIKYSERGNMPARKPILCQESEFSAPAAREVRRASAVGVFNRLHKGLHMTHNPDTTSPSVSALALTISDLIPSSLDGNSSRLPSDAGRAHPRPWLRAHGRAGPPSRPDTGDVSVSGLAGIKATINHEPRIRDLRLAEVLGFVDPHKIRELIERHADTLTTFGEVFRQTAENTGRRGRPSKGDYWLSKRQALYLTAKSDTERGALITVQMVEVFDAFTAGHLLAAPEAAPALPPLAPAEEPSCCKGCAIREWRLQDRADKEGF